jgi:hypothetical protein
MLHTHCYANRYTDRCVHTPNVALHTHTEQPLLQVLLEKSRDSKTNNSEEQRIESRLDVLLGADTASADEMHTDMLNMHTTVASLLRAFPHAAAAVQLVDLCKVQFIYLK